MERKDDCGLLIREIHTMLEKDANRHMQAVNLTFAQFSVLMFLYGSGKEKVLSKEIQSALHLAQSTSAGLISRLESKGYVTCLPDSDDRRLKWVSLSAEGRKRCDEAEAVRQDSEERILRAVAPDRRDEFISMLRAIRDDMKTEFNK
ncbi:MAG: MarR family winged helix-turn-helix transcriptional regulator [Lentihominibacter sp.]